MYLEYIVHIPADSHLRNCRDARALLARLHAAAMPAERFDLRLLHLEADGKPRHAASVIRVGSRTDALAISAVGSGAVECVLSNAPKIGALIARHSGVPLQETHRQGECEAHPTVKLCAYDAPSLVLSRRNFDREQDGVSLRRILTERCLDHPALLRQIRAVVTAGIQRQADACLLDLPNWLMGDIVVHRLAPVFV